MRSTFHRALQMRPILHLATLRSSVHSDLRVMRTTTLFSLPLSALYIALVTIESRDASREWSRGDFVRCVACALACVQVALSVMYYRASLSIRKSRGFISEDSER